MHKRTINAKDIVNDIHKGLTDLQLMSKYGLSLNGLQSVFTKLVQAKAILPQDLFDRPPFLADDSVTVENIRIGPREKIELTIPVCDAADPNQVGTLRDLSPEGIGVRGIETRKGQIRTLLVVPSHWFPVDAFSLEAVCRWVKRRRAEGIVDAGFEITGISEESKKRLKTTIRLLNLPE
ncbi:MAG: hypothetical protein ACLQPD_06285 [Desulfomonilaceae bacterium]